MLQVKFQRFRKSSELSCQSKSTQSMMIKQMIHSNLNYHHVVKHFFNVTVPPQQYYGINIYKFHVIFIYKESVLINIKSIDSDLKRNISTKRNIPPMEQSLRFSQSTTFDDILSNSVYPTVYCSKRQRNPVNTVTVIYPILNQYICGDIYIYIHTK